MDLGALTTARAIVLNLLEPVKLTVWKVMIERVTVVKFRVNYGGGSDIRLESCFFLPHLQSTPPLYRTLVRVNAYKCAKFLLPRFISY